MAEQQPQNQGYTSTYSIPYSNLSTLNTLDLHFPTNPSPQTRDSGLWLIYIHGGAFRDPDVTSLSILLTLPFLSSTSHPIYGIASLNYRLSAYPHHATKPSQVEDPARSARWPDYLDDVRAGIKWVLEHGESVQGDKGVGKQAEVGNHGGREKRRYILAGHSVGATMTMMIAQQSPSSTPSSSPSIPPPLAILPLCGIYNFHTLRDAHPANKSIYESFTTAAFGPEDQGGWNRGDCTRKEIREEVKVVVLGHGKGDGLVEWGQCEEMRGVLRGFDGEGDGSDKGGGERKAVVVEVEGDHNDVWKEGREIARCVDRAMEMLGEGGWL